MRKSKVNPEQLKEGNNKIEDQNLKMLKTEK